MLITICGSIAHIKKMVDVKNELLSLGCKVEVPHNAELFLKEKDFEETKSVKMKNWYINEHLKKIKKSDAILVVNEKKNNIENYIGGNTFLEMGFAFALNKPIFLMNDIPDMPYTEEIKGMLPKVLNDLSDIKSFLESVVK